MRVHSSTPPIGLDVCRGLPGLPGAKAASALDHPNICTIFEINETPDGQLYLVMAHYEGETLKERPLDRISLADNRAISRLTPRETQAYF